MKLPWTKRWKPIPQLDWSEAYHSDAVAQRADEILRDRVANLIDEARDRAKYK